MQDRSELSVILHGGGGKASPEHARNKIKPMEAALDAAWTLLCQGAPGVRAVEAALRVMEGSQYFNAGYGGYPNVNGVVLTDVGVMTGQRDFVALLNVRRVTYPSSVACDMLREGKAHMTVWTHSHEQLLDAESESKKSHYGVVKTHEDLVAPYVRQLIERKIALEVRQGDEIPDDESEVGGTVGCVVRDASGELCAGTSTGGVSLKANGRIGDSPIVGSGLFADSEICGLSTTGHGESLLRSCMSGFVIGEIRRALRDNPDCFAENRLALQEILRNEIRQEKPLWRGNGCYSLRWPPRLHF
ncbi:MAG: isoaspartyl peptidase/L-asparaginase [Bdellovibrionales bacterium]|nr:isoaspartyl peptidase/L-asparaginase [Bdellovibrionales bacterium]